MALLRVSMAHDISETILYSDYAVQEGFLIIINVENTCPA